jgi:signal transduction histidine kinase
VLKQLCPNSSLLGADLAAFKRQESIFVLLNLILLAALLFFHAFFASYWGAPTQLQVIVLSAGFVLKALELGWVQRLKRIPPPTVLILLTWASILLNLSLAVLLARLTDHEDSPYFVLTVVPILEAAFRFHLVTVLAVVSIASFYNVIWVWGYFQRHPPVEVGEYFETGITSFTFLIVGVLVWRLVNDLRKQEVHLLRNLAELQRAKESLLQEEKLAAVGRLSSAIAHEIRNPVAMISSSIAAGRQLSGPERDEMFEIASEEATRLVTLTTEFLAYARPRQPKLAPTSVADTVAYVADAARALASEKGVQFQLETPETLLAEMDGGLVQQALLNLIVNAVGAARAGSTIFLRSHTRDHRICIEVENSGSPIPAQEVERIFEPFFTTKTHGSGLGLPIARNIARAHGGDLVVEVNAPDRVCFALLLPALNGHSTASTTRDREEQWQEF